MHLLEQLKRDHRHLLDLMRRAGQTSVRARAARTELLAMARSSFDRLADVKESELLPALRASSGADDADVDGSLEARLIASAYELEQARRLFDEVRDMDPGDRRWIVRLSFLGEHLERHFAADQREIYPLAKRIPSAQKASQVKAEGRPLVTHAAATRDGVESLWV